MPTDIFFVKATGVLISCDTKMLERQSSLMGLLSELSLSFETADIFGPEGFPIYDSLRRIDEGEYLIIEVKPGVRLKDFALTFIEQYFLNAGKDTKWPERLLYFAAMHAAQEKAEVMRAAIKKLGAMRFTRKYCMEIKKTALEPYDSLPPELTNLKHPNLSWQEPRIKGIALLEGAKK